MEQTSIDCSHSFACSAATVWQACTRPSWLLDMHPFVKSHETPVLPFAEGVEDSLEYYSGIRLQRRIVAWEPGVAGELEASPIGPDGQPAGKARVRMETEDRGASCTVTVTITQDGVAGDAQITMVKDYLHKMLQGFAYYCETGKPVQRNQFGSHPFYSP